MQSREQLQLGRRLQSARLALRKRELGRKGGKRGELVGPEFHGCGCRLPRTHSVASERSRITELFRESYGLNGFALDPIRCARHK